MGLTLCLGNVFCMLHKTQSSGRQFNSDFLLFFGWTFTCYLLHENGWEWGFELRLFAWFGKEASFFDVPPFFMSQDSFIVKMTISQTRSHSSGIRTNIRFYLSTFRLCVCAQNLKMETIYGYFLKSTIQEKKTFFQILADGNFIESNKIVPVQFQFEGQFTTSKKN